MSSQTYVDSVTLSSATEWNRWDTAAYCYLTGVAGTNTITAGGPANLSLATPQHPLVLVPAVTNSGATTINITPSGGAALGAKAVFCNGAACVGGELRVGVPSVLVYDGTQYQIVGPSGFSGSYTPTMTAGTNCDSVTTQAAQFARVGNFVMVSGTGNLDPTSSATQTDFGISLPVASNFSDALQCGGALAATTLSEYMAIISDAANDRAMVSGICGATTSNHTFSYSFMYKVL